MYNVVKGVVLTISLIVSITINRIVIMLKIKEFPIKDLILRGYLKGENLEKELLDFFGVDSFDDLNKIVKELDVSFRHSLSYNSSRDAILSWLQIAKKEVACVKIETYSRTKFEQSLKYIRDFTTEKQEEFEPKIKELCRMAGVALVIVHELKGTRLSGATIWLDKNPVIILSLRHKTNDHFWFSFYHEAAHVLHDDKKKHSFINFDGKRKSEEEKKADEFSANYLIPNKEYDEFIKVGVFTKNSIIGFAKSINIAPGIVLGRLQKDRLLTFNHILNKSLKNNMYVWSYIGDKLETWHLLKDETIKKQILASEKKRKCKEFVPVEVELGA